MTTRVSIVTKLNLSFFLFQSKNAEPVGDIQKGGELTRVG